MIRLNNDQKFNEAKDMIDKFVVQLLELNNGENIPPTWKNYFIKAIHPIPKKSGRKLDLKKHADIINRLIDDLRIINDEQEFGHSAEYKDKIANEFGVARKTIDRKIDAINRLFDDKALDPDLKKVTIEGVSDHICDRIEADEKEEEKVKQKRVELFNKKNRILHSK